MNTGNSRPIQKGALPVMQRCLITASASRRTANAVSCELENKAHLLDSDHVLILNASLTRTDKSFSHGLTRALCLCILPLSFGTNPNIP